MPECQTVFIELPLLPPSVNAVWRHGRRRAWKSSRYETWIDSASKEVVSRLKGQRVTGFCGVVIKCVKPSRRKMDLDNRLKGLLDLLVLMSVIDDDSFIQRIEIEWVTVGAPVQIWVISTNEVPLPERVKNAKQDF